MHHQLAVLVRELDAVTDGARALVRPLDEARFQARPAPTRWSVAECLEHLNLTTAAYLPLIDAALASASTADRDLDRRYRRDLPGWLLSWSLEPPARMRMKTIPRFIPTAARSREEILADFERLQRELKQRLERASGLDLSRLRIQSPFNERLRYNLYSCFRVLAAHERRHLWQAERARSAP